MLKKILLGLLALIVLCAVVFFAPGVLSGDLTNETRVLVEKDRAHVWEKFEDESKMGEWMPNFKSIETIEKKEGRVGSKFKIVFDNEGEDIEMIETMTAYKEGESFSFTIENEVIHSEIDIELIDKGLTTEVVQNEKFRGQNIFWHSLFYWLKSTFTENSKNVLNSFKKYAEGE